MSPPTTTRPAHAPLTQFPVDKAQRVLGGRTLLHLAKRVAQTPFYAHDCGSLSARVAELRQAVAARVLAKVESIREAQWLSAISGGLGLPARVAVRVNTDVELKSSGMKMGGGPKQFGSDVEQMPKLLATIGSAGLTFEGFHLFAGSQNLRAESICEAQLKSYELALRQADAAPGPVRFLSLGGSFGIPYSPGEKRLGLRAIGDDLDRLVARAGDRPARGLAGHRTGALPGGRGGHRCYAPRRPQGLARSGLPGHRRGLNHHYSGSGNLRQVIRKNYAVTFGNRVDSIEREVASGVGPLCTLLDLLADRMDLPVAQVGDLAVLIQSGACGASASPQAFLGHPPCIEVLV